MSNAVTIAQEAVSQNNSATLAFICIQKGYLVYDVRVKDNSNDTTTAVRVDARNGMVLYKQIPPSRAFSFGFGNHHVFGQDKIGQSFGGHGAGRGFSDHSSGTMMRPQSRDPVGSFVS
ncbi:MAG TPA: hypothetical protein VE593_03835 [Nitrososphaeraceae archaeon]|nr:hypothetical protein [Nitrososphaeraceae archaeon]